VCPFFFAWRLFTAAGNLGHSANVWGFFMFFCGSALNLVVVFFFGLFEVFLPLRLFTILCGLLKF